MKCYNLQLFEEKPEVILNTYILEDSKELLDGKKRPAVIINPGGAYLDCSDREAEPIAMAFANMGYHAFVLYYSTALSKGTDLMEAMQCPGKLKDMNKEAQFPNTIIELGKAMLTVREHADEWNVDEERIAVCGFSAGAHNTAMYANMWGNEILTGALNTTADKLRPAASVLGYPVIDYRLMYEDDIQGIPMLKDFFKLSAIGYLGKGEPNGDMLERVSPNLHVSDNTPPTFIWATAKDHLVPAENSARLAVALAAKGIPFEIHIFENGDHGLATATQASAATLDQLNADAAKWISLVDAWLVKRFALPIKEPIYKMSE